MTELYNVKDSQNIAGGGGGVWNLHKLIPWYEELNFFRSSAKLPLLTQPMYVCTNTLQTKFESVEGVFWKFGGFLGSMGLLSRLGGFAAPLLPGRAGGVTVGVGCEQLRV